MPELDHTIRDVVTLARVMSAEDLEATADRMLTAAAVLSAIYQARAPRAHALWCARVAAERDPALGAEETTVRLPIALT